MARIDSLIRMLVGQEGDEIRLIIGREPALTKKGAPLRLFFPAVSDAMFEQLTAELLTPERRDACRATGRARFQHQISGFVEMDAAFLGHDARQLWMGRGGAQAPSREFAAEANADAAPSTPSFAPRNRAFELDEHPDRPGSEEPSPPRDEPSPAAQTAPTAEEPTQSRPAPNAPAFTHTAAPPAQRPARAPEPAGGEVRRPPPVEGPARTNAPTPPPMGVTGDPRDGSWSRPKAPGSPRAEGGSALHPTAARPVGAGARPAEAGSGARTTPQPASVRGRAGEAAPRPTADPAVLPSPLARLVLLAAEVHATDLHLCTGERPSVRLDRGLAPLEGEPPLDEIPWLDGMLPAHAHAIDLGFDSPSGHRLRVHVYRHDRGLAAAVRILPGGVPSLHRLGFPLPIDDLASLRHGLVLFGGPVGSGKSTSMFALAREVLRTRGGVAVTIEDPVEFPFAPDNGAAVVRQRLVGRDVPTMAAGLRQALREDPDMIVLSELRDAESILLALTAAETGTLVLATMHCRSGASAVERILDSVPPERLKQAQGQLAEALRAVVVQRLLPRADRNGRALAVEVLRGTRAVASQIREGKTGHLTTTIQTGARDGMLPLERSLTQLVEQRRITLETARHNCNDPDSLAQMLRQVGESG